MRESRLEQFLENRRGIPSYCSSSALVLAAAFRRAKKTGLKALLEATANQVNQAGGYTGMTPEMFYDYACRIADDEGISVGDIIFGGDHLGPLTWSDLPEAEAMEMAEELVYSYVLAGFTKIHLDTSMRLASDEKSEPLPTLTVAQRGARLYKAAMRGYEDRLKKYPDAKKPFFIIGSEVPIPGGATEAEDKLTVTNPKDFEATVRIYREVFEAAGISEGLSDIVAVVVQPGVEFGNEQIFRYDRAAARSLCDRLKECPSLCFEGHSTDYQTERNLREMVEDGIRILKVGPALTYALREALFALCKIEEELVEDKEARSFFIERLEEAMLQNPKQWQGHYHGTEAQKRLSRRYGLPDRSRYYMGEPVVVEAMERLFANIGRTGIPLGILHQYMPITYDRFQQGLLTLEPREIAIDAVEQVMELYDRACE